MPCRENGLGCVAISVVMRSPRRATPFSYSQTGSPSRTIVDDTATTRTGLVGRVLFAYFERLGLHRFRFFVKPHFKPYRPASKTDFAVYDAHSFVP